VGVLARLMLVVLVVDPGVMGGDEMSRGIGIRRVAPVDETIFAVVSSLGNGWLVPLSHSKV